MIFVTHTRAELVGGKISSQEELVVAACEEALEASERLDPALASASFALQVLAGGGVVASACDRDDMQRPVDLPVATAIETVTVFAPG